MKGLLPFIRVGIFLNEAVFMRLIGAVLFEQKDERQISSPSTMVAAVARIGTETIHPNTGIATKAASSSPKAIRDFTPMSRT